jgi:hypothetical protein
LEACTKDLLRSIYVVLDSKRLDKSFEKMDSPPYIQLKEEEKYIMGIDNVKSKNYKYIFLIFLKIFKIYFKKKMYWTSP